MEIIINGQLACLKKNTSFEYISENSMFTGSDSYTLTITFPLKDCPQNIAIFGHIHRQDVEKSKVVFDCDIRDKGFFKSGSITITQISETEVKTQFLEGRSEQNFDDTFDDIYLNELNLGYPDAEQRKMTSNPIPSSWLDAYPDNKWVALPWVNNTSGNLQNSVTKDSNGNFQWGTNSYGLTFQPYLLHILDKICEAIGYTGDFGVIRNSVYRYLLICNTLPAAWRAWNFAIALPHWSLTEFFEELEKLMHGEFSINQKAKTISFEFSHKIASRTEDVHIEKVINKYSVEVSRENKSEYIGASNMKYTDNDNRFWPYQSCQWYIDENKKKAMVFNTLQELLIFAKDLKECGVQTTVRGRIVSTSYSRGYPAGSDGNKLFYAADVDTYFMMWCYKSELVYTFHSEQENRDYHWYKYTNRLMPVNQFGRLVTDKEAEDTELNIVPAWIDETDEELGPCLYLECGEMGSAVSWTSETDENGNTSGGLSGGGQSTSGGHNYGGPRHNADSARNNEVDETDYDNGALAQTTVGKAIAKGEKEKSDAYFDNIYVGFWDGESRPSDKMPHPVVDKVEITDDFTAVSSPYSLRLQPQEGNDQQGVPLKYIYSIDNRKRYTFSFLADEIPNPRALFYIEGSRYVCEKITATFHEGTGKSQLLKISCFRVLEST